MSRMTTKRCKIERCTNPVLAQGLCVKHYWRMKRTGDPVATGKPGPNVNGEVSVDPKKTIALIGPASKKWYSWRRSCVG